MYGEGWASFTFEATLSRHDCHGLGFLKLGTTEFPAGHFLLQFLCITGCLAASLAFTY